MFASAFIPQRFYVENITQLKDIITVELFFLNAKSAVYNVSVFLLFFLVFEVMKHDSGSFFFFFTEQLPDDSLSLDPCSTSAQQTAPAGHNFLTLLAGI